MPPIVIPAVPSALVLMKALRLIVFMVVG